MATMASSLAVGRALGRVVGPLRFARPLLSTLGGGAGAPAAPDGGVAGIMNSSSVNSSCSGRSLSSFSKWKTSFLDGFDQALAGPGRLANAERVVADFTRGGGGRDFEEGDWRLQTDKGIGGTTQASAAPQGDGAGAGEPQGEEENFLRFSGTLCAPFALPPPPAKEKPKRAKKDEKKAIAAEEAGEEAKEGEGEGKEPEVRLGTAFAVLQNKGVFDGVDMEPYRSLVCRVRGDGRKYIVSLRTENWIIPGTVSDDVYQGYIQPRKGEWEEILLPFDKFLLTWQGKVVDGATVMNHRNLLSLAFASVGVEYDLPEAGQGSAADADTSTTGKDFCLDIQWVKATSME